MTIKSLTDYIAHEHGCSIILYNLEQIDIEGTFW